MKFSIEDRTNLFDLDGAEREALIAVGKVVTENLDGILSRFYDFALGDSRTSGFFSDPSLVTRARNAQKSHWAKLVSADFGSAYQDSADRIGRVHFRIQLPFTYYLSAYSRATSDIQDVVIKAWNEKEFANSAPSLSAMLGALNRAFAMDTEMVIEAYFAAQNEEQSKAFDFLSNGIKSMSDRDLTARIPDPSQSDFPARYNSLREDFNFLAESLSGVLTDVAQSVEVIDSSVTEIASGTDDLSSRTQSQAAALEESSAALQEMSANLANSAERTRETDKVANDAKVSAERGGQVASSAVAAMTQIEQSSNEISGRIMVIDDIAFQTNLLALNAGVEAARAGDAGRGFAVVAQEVRALAQRAADAAKDIKKLIVESDAHVKSGVQQVGQAGEALSEIVGGVENITSLVAELAAASAEQSTGLKEIDGAITHLDSNTQQNAAMAEQTTAATQGLQSRSQQLSQLIQSFTLDRQNGRGGRDVNLTVVEGRYGAHETGSAQRAFLAGE